MQQKIAHYQIKELIGEGSFARVYRAYDEKFEQDVALKILKPIWLSDPQAITRFKQEARTIRKLNHTNIINVYDVGEEDGQVYLAQLLVVGETLAERLNREPLEWEVTLKITQSIGAALDYAHSEGVIHRDIKPANILLGYDGRIYLGDFGLVKAVEGSTHLSSTTSMIGTAHYMAPEVWDGKEATPATDVYALSCVIFEMVTGKVLFEGSSMAAVTKHHIVGPQFPEEWPVGVPAGVGDVLQRGLVENPDNRFQSAGELTTSLAALDDSTKPVHPPLSTGTPTPAMDRPPKNASSWLVTGGVVFIVLIIAAIAFFALSTGGNSSNEAAVVTPPTDTPMAASATEEPTATPNTQATIDAAINATSTKLATNAQNETNTAATVAAILTSAAEEATATVTAQPTNTPTPETSPTVPHKPTSTPTQKPTNTPRPPTRTPLPPTRTPTSTRTPTATPPVTTNVISEEQAQMDWASSGHAAADEEAFVHWNGDNPPEIPEDCAKCHSTPGFLDFIGADGSGGNVVNRAAPTGTVIECAACHNEKTRTMSSVVMPSGARITNLGAEATCMQCHQGRLSTDSVNDALSGTDGDDTFVEDMGFQNIHYFAAAATLYGAEARGGYQYTGRTYQQKFAHVKDYDTCIECHDAHTLVLKVEICGDCHAGATNKNGIKKIHNSDAPTDYDGDGDSNEGLYYEVHGVREVLLQAIRAYGTQIDTPIAYRVDSYPYFYIDNDSDGRISDTEADFDNRYNHWTPRLIKATYNYQVSLKDPGAYTHNGKYILQLLYDSIEDLNKALTHPIELKKLNRPD